MFRTSCFSTCLVNTIACIACIEILFVTLPISSVLEVLAYTDPMLEPWGRGGGGTIAEMPNNVGTGDLTFLLEGLFPCSSSLW